jgi:DnaJ-class molecular chaperone
MAVEFKDYYRILGVDRSADDKAIKSAYRKLARRYHPDVAKGKDAGERFREVTEAYEVLSDPEKRRRYDTLGPDWQRFAQQAPGGRPGGVHVEYGDLGDFSEFFRSIFGDMGGGRQGRPGPGRAVDFDDLLGGFTSGRQRARGQDVQASVTITLEEAYSGTRKTLEFEVEEPCPTCRGAGNAGGKPCPTCHGGGWQRGRHEVDVKIPAGVRTGQKVRVSGQGGAGGDLYLVVTVALHREFERRGDDVHLSVPITAPEAALGVTLEIPTLRGKVSMKVPPATSSGRTFRLPGYGLPRLKGGGTGDQLVTARIVMPADLTADERALYERLKALRRDSPRGGYAQG